MPMRYDSLGNYLESLAALVALVDDLFKMKVCEV